MEIHLKCNNRIKGRPKISDMDSLITNEIFKLPGIDEVFEIFSIYIDPMYRRQGIGSFIIKKVIESNNESLICCTARDLNKDSITRKGMEVTEAFINAKIFFKHLNFRKVEFPGFSPIEEHMVYPNKVGLEFIKRMEEIA